MAEERTSTGVPNREPEPGPTDDARLSWLAKAAGAVSFQGGIYLRIKDDPRSTLQSILTTFGAVALMSLLAAQILGWDYGGAFPPWAWLGWTILLFPWTGILFALAGGAARSVHYVELLNGVGFAMLGMIVPEGIRTMAYAMFGDAGAFPIAGPLFVLTVVWVVGMQIHAVREIVGSSWVRSVTAVVAPPATVALVGVIVVASWLGVFAASDDTYLPGLLDDPVADMTLHGVELEHSSESEQSDSGLFGGTRADVARTYRVVEIGTGQGIFDLAVSQAREAGWDLDPAGPEAGLREALSIRGYKILEPGPAELSLSLDERGDSLRLHLDYGSEAPWVRDGTAMSIGSTVTVSDMNGGRNEYVTFEGTAGDVVTLDINPSLQPGDLDVIVAMPGGATIWATLDDESPADTANIRFGPTELSETGTYIVLLDPATGDRASVRLDLRHSGQDTPGAAEVTMQLGSRILLEPTPGQTTHVRFQSQRGKWVSVYIESSYPADQVSANVEGPDGEPPWDDVDFSALRDVGSSLYLDAVELPFDGIYTMTFEPQNHEGGWISVEVFDATTHRPDSFGGFDLPLHLEDQFYTPGQNLYWVMEGSPGDRVEMEFNTEGLLTADASNPGLHVEVSAPSGGMVWEGEIQDGSGQSDAFTLEEPGQYSIFLDPIGPTVGHFDLKVDRCGVEIPSC